jgi:DNA-binding winged helix-turn-helix (wHTH) protein
MEQSATAHRVLRFALFEVDLDSGELRKNGVKQKIQEQPFRILCLLLHRRGEIVTREELQQKLWPDGTFVDFEHGVSTAVKKLREVLGDDADNPRFVETVPRRGYRFIAPAGGKDSIPAGSPASDHPRIARRTIAMFAAVLVIAVVAVFVWRMLWSDRPSLRIIRSQQVTFTGDIRSMGWVETAQSIQTDGRRIYYSDFSFRLRYVAVGGGEAELVAASPNPVVLLHISPDGSTLLARQALGSEGASEAALWLVPANGGPPRRLGDIEAQDAAWSPDGKTIAFAQGQSLFLTDDRGNNPRKLAATPGRAFWLRWSPDGKRLRFTVKDPKVGTRTLWETRLDGSPHQLLADWKDAGNLCNGIWSPDGKSYLFLNIRNGQSQLWSLPERRFPWTSMKPTPVVLIAAGVQFIAATASPLQKELFVVGVRPSFSDVVALDPVTKRSTQLLPGILRNRKSTARDYFHWRLRNFRLGTAR